MTKAELREIIKLELGYPQLQVELTDAQLNQAIDKSIRQFTNIAYDGELIQYVKFTCQGRGEYNVAPEVEEIMTLGKYDSLLVSSNLSGYVDDNVSRMITDGLGTALAFMINISSLNTQLKKYVDKEINYNYNSYKKKLYIFEDYHGNLLLECRTRYIQDENGDSIYEQEWVQRRAVAEARLMQSVVLGKYSANVVGGATINYADIRSLAESEIEKLNEELLSKWQDLPPVMVC